MVCTYVEGDVIMDLCLTRAELLKVDDVFKQSLLPWWEDISFYVENANKDFTFNYLPAVVIQAFDYLGLEKDIGLSMANLFKIIYFANTIHILVKDEEEGQVYNKGLQYSILLGDYVFGVFLKFMLENKVDNLLNIFADMMSVVSEGLIIEYKLDGDLVQTIEKTRAPFYATAFIIAAKLSGMVEKTTEFYGEIGYNLGMAIELKNRKSSRVNEYLCKSEELIMNFNKYYDGGKRTLQNLVNGMANNDFPASTAVAG